MNALTTSYGRQLLRQTLNYWSIYQYSLSVLLNCFYYVIYLLRGIATILVITLLVFWWVAVTASTLALISFSMRAGA